MSAWTWRHTDGKVVQKIVPPRPRIPWWKGPGADSEEKQEPASDIDTALVDSLKVLDPKYCSAAIGSDGPRLCENGSVSAPIFSATVSFVITERQSA